MQHIYSSVFLEIIITFSSYIATPATLFRGGRAASTYCMLSAFAFTFAVRERELPHIQPERLF